MKTLSKWKVLLPLALAVAATGTALVLANILAAPPLPSEFSGTVKVDGQSVADGTVVEGLVDGTIVAGTTTTFTFGTDSVYILPVGGDDPDTTTQKEGGIAGDTVQFKVAGKLATQTGTWASGGSVTLNLTVVSAVGPKTLTVNKTQDTNDGTCNTADCSLREALAAAASGDKVVVPTGIYTLTFGSQLTIAESLTVEGAGSGDTFIQAHTQPDQGIHRVFTIATGVVAKMSMLTVRHGKAVGDGGGILNNGILKIEDALVTANSTSANGGGIQNSGSLTLARTRVASNTAPVGAGIYNMPGSMVVLESSTVAQNSGQTGAGIHNLSNGTLKVNNTTISGNLATQNGGGIHSAGTADLTNSRISNNTATVNGGGIYIGAGTTTISSSTVSGNIATQGNSGGIFNGASLILSDSTISGNTASDSGGGILSPTGSTLAVTNSTFSGNTATSALGGGILSEGTTTITNSTVTGNTAGLIGGGIRKSGTLNLVNTIVSGNTAPTGPDCHGSPTSLGHNLIRNSADCSFTPAAGDLVGTAASPIDPKLRQLVNNGGPTFTHALIFDSPAVDAADDAQCPEADQRGVIRPQGACDIGAYEFVSAALTVTGSVLLEGMPNPITGVRLSFSTGGAPTRVFSDPKDGSFEVQIPPGTFTVIAEKDGFLKATTTGAVENQNVSLPTVTLLGGDSRNNGVIDAFDLVIPAKNIGATESPWPTSPP